MVLSWLRSRILPDARFLRYLKEARWDKLVPDHQQEALAQFITRAALTPGRNKVLLRIAAGREALEYLWAEYEIVSADLDRCDVILRTLYVGEEGYELETPDVLQGQPFFAVEAKNRKEPEAEDRKAA